MFIEKLPIVQEWPGDRDEDGDGTASRRSLILPVLLASRYFTRMTRRVALFLLSVAIVAAPAAAIPGPDMILFENGSSRISPMGAAVLDNFVAGAPYFPDGTIVVIEGRTDRVGPQKANRRLSCERARVVERYIVARGIHSGRTQLFGYGEARPLVDTADEVSEPQNRSATIFTQPGRAVMMRVRGRDAVLIPDPQACEP